jgi:hypothetical protein
MIGEEQIAAFPSTVERDLRLHAEAGAAIREVVAELSDDAEPRTLEELIDSVVAAAAVRLAEAWTRGEAGPDRT